MPYSLALSAPPDRPRSRPMPNSCALRQPHTTAWTQALLKDDVIGWLFGPASRGVGMLDTSRLSTLEEVAARAAGALYAGRGRVVGGHVAEAQRREW